jgi:hypothetical protein
LRGLAISRRAGDLLALDAPGSYTAELFRKTAIPYPMLPYVGVYLGLAFWLKFVDWELWPASAYPQRSERLE